MSYSTGIGNMHGLGYLDPRAASKACNADCANNPIAATCKDSGLEVYAQECNYDTGKAVTCNCRKPRITKTEGPPIRINPTYGNIIPENVGMNGLNESFIESLGNLANLAILGLAIYGGYCLSKKF